MRTLKVGDGRVHRLAYTPDNRSLVIQERPGGFVRSVRWWDWQAGAEEFVWEVSGEVVLSPDHALILAPSEGRDYAVLHDGKTLRRLKQFEVEGIGYDAGFAPDCSWVVVVSRPEGHSPEPHPERTAKRYVKPPRPLPAGPEGVAFSPDGQTCAFAFQDCSIVTCPIEDAWDAGGGDEIEPEGEDGWIRRLLYLDERTLLVLSAASEAGEGLLPAGPYAVALWDVTTAERRPILGAPRARVHDLALSADRRLAATAGADGALRLWDAKTWKERQAFDLGAGPLGAVALSPDGMTCAAGGEEGRLVIWDLE
jgi:hypothetical protein